MSNLATKLKSWLKAIVIGVVIAFIVRSFIFSSYTVEGGCIVCEWSGSRRGVLV